MNNIIWAESYEEYDEWAKQAVKKDLKLIAVSRSFSWVKKDNYTEYDIDVGKPYIGLMVIDEQEDRCYCLLDFGKMKAGEL